MSVYYLPPIITNDTDTDGFIAHLAGVLGDTTTTVDEVVRIRTENPAIIAVIERLLGPVPATAVETEKPVKKARSPRKPKAQPAETPDLTEQELQQAAHRARPGSNGEVHLLPAPVDPPIDPDAPSAALPLPAVEDKPLEPPQLMTYRLPNGKETNDLTYALKHGKLQVGDVVRHKRRGDFRVVDGRDGLMLEQVAA